MWERKTLFGILKPLNPGTIWIVSCDVAKGEGGQSFCQTLANVAGTQVIALDEDQVVTSGQGLQLGLVWFYNHIDELRRHSLQFHSRREDAQRD